MKCSRCSTEIRPVVSVDIDGTLGDHHGYFVTFAEWYLGVTLPHDYAGEVPFNEALGIDKTTYRDIKLAYRQGGMKRSMPIFSGARAFMENLHLMGFEVWIATTRPYLRLDNIDPDTREWMRRHRIDADGILYDENKYEELVKIVEPSRVVAVVEDLLEQCELAAKAGLDAWQPMRDHNRLARWKDDRTFGDFFTLQTVLEDRLSAWRRKHGTSHG